MNNSEMMKTVEVEGWMLGWASEEERPRIRDVDLAERLGYERPRDIRKLIRRLRAEEKLNDFDLRATVARRQEPGMVAPVEVEEFWLTEEAALLVTSQSDTAKAWEMTRTVIRIFRLAVRGELPGRLGAESSQLEDRIGKLEAQLAMEKRFQALETVLREHEAAMQKQDAAHREQVTRLTAMIRAQAEGMAILCAVLLDFNQQHPHLEGTTPGARISRATMLAMLEVVPKECLILEPRLPSHVGALEALGLAPLVKGALVGRS
jgi:hypothetical protein